MILPSVHLNGTSREELERQYAAAAGALNAAIAALIDAGPNGRDYYVQGPAALSAALTEHESRLRALRAVRDDLEVIGLHVADA